MSMRPLQPRESFKYSVTAAVVGSSEQAPTFRLLSRSRNIPCATRYCEPATAGQVSSSESEHCYFGTGGSDLLFIFATVPRPEQFQNNCCVIFYPSLLSRFVSVPEDFLVVGVQYESSSNSPEKKDLLLLLLLLLFLLLFLISGFRFIQSVSKPEQASKPVLCTGVRLECASATVSASEGLSSSAVDRSWRDLSSSAVDRSWRDLNKWNGFRIFKYRFYINTSCTEVEKFKYLGATVTNINDTREEIKHRINMGNACYYSVEKLLSSSLLSKNLKVRIDKTVILPVVLYGCETWTLTLREEHRLRVFENKVLRKIFGAKRDEVTGEWRKLHNTELHALYSSPDN
ncbi:hypothetical protein ANN_20156 [Periplaneta americana]|uniref:Uncharacterized protein n=1 Tax=Periplaneta americana TaxID=6978 RepID=A0ABQ8SD04_PERAM|nr:hypothetical protein ANN_20156 [Periplaneta americana]